MAKSNDKKKAKAKARTDLPRDVWHGKSVAVQAGDFEFRVRGERDGEVKFVMDVDDSVLALDWAEGGDEGGILTGSITTRRAKIYDLRVGDAVVCEYRTRGRGAWSGAWKMYLTQPEYQVAERQYSYQLQDGLLRLSKSKATFRFRKDKKHPKGWKVSDAVREVLKRFDIKVGLIPEMNHRITKLTLTNQAPVSAVAKLLRTQRTATGVRYFLRWIGDKIYILPFQRGPLLLQMGGYLASATLIETQRESFATILDCVATKDKGKGKDSKGRKRHKKVKLKTTVMASKAVRQRYGSVRRTVKHNDADSVAELRAWGKRELARRGHIKRDLSFSHPGVPTLRMGDAMKVRVPSAGLGQEVCFASSVSHTVQPGSYTMEVGVDFTDRYANARQERIKKAKAAAAARRKRKSKTDDDDKPKTARSSQRS